MIVSRHESERPIIFFLVGGSCLGCVLGDSGWLGLGMGSVRDVKVPKENASLPNDGSSTEKSRACFAENG